MVEHWIDPGTYEWDLRLGLVKPMPSDPFWPGDRIVCTETWHPLSGEYRGQEAGEEFTVRAYLRSHNYLILEESKEGYVNAERFARINKEAA